MQKPTKPVVWSLCSNLIYELGHLVQCAMSDEINEQLATGADNSLKST